MIWQVVQPGGPPHDYWSRVLPTLSVEGALPGAKPEDEFEKLDEAILAAYERGAMEVRVYGRPLRWAEKRRWYGRRVFYQEPSVW